MSWQVLLGINLIAASVREFLNKKVVNARQPIVGFFYIVAFGQFWLYIINWFTTGSLPPFSPLVSVTGLILVIGLLAYFSAVRISLSQSILFQSYSILVTIFLSAIFLGEGKYFDITTLLGIKVIGGIVLAFLSLWYLLHVGNKREEKLERIWFVYIIFTILFLGVGSFLTISFMRTTPLLSVIINQNNSALLFVFLFLLLFKRTELRVPKQFLTLTFLNSFFSTIAVLAFYHALLLAPVAKLYPVQQVSLVVLTIITGVVFYNEKEVLSGKHLLGMGLGMVGILLLVTS